MEDLNFWWINLTDRLGDYNSSIRRQRSRCNTCFEQSRCNRLETSGRSTLVNRLIEFFFLQVVVITQL